MTAPLVIAPYDPAWPDRFERERVLLSDAFRGAEVAIEHIGSTAVPGLGAKPVIDIVAGVRALSDVTARIPRLEALGYEYVPEYERELPGRRYFRKPRTRPRAFHLHCVVRGSGSWRDYRAFRDHLRAHPESAAAYLRLKRDLAARHAHDAAAYTRAKGEFVSATLALP